MHEIRYLDFLGSKSESAIVKECGRIADTNGDYKGQIRGIRFKDAVLKDRSEAEQWIVRNDNGWYDNLAVRYKDGKKYMWLVKIEYHC